MARKIEDGLRDLLMEDGRVSLPGIGTLTVTRQPALISQLESRALPPADKVSFNANLVMDDGKLVHYLTEGGLSREAAESEVQAYLAQCRETLDAGRSLNLEGIGRLFKHHNGNMTFTSTGDNFGKQNFGLPALDVQHIIRNERRRPNADKDPISGRGAQSRAQTQSDKRRSFLYDPQVSRFLWIAAIALSAIVVLWLGYHLLRNLASDLSADPNPIARRDDLPRDRINVAPPPAPEPRVGVTPADEVDPEEPPLIGDYVPDQSEETDDDNAALELEDFPAHLNDEYSPTPIGETEAVIAIGLYGQQRNVDKMVVRLTEIGYEPYAQREGRLTRVGAIITYDNEEVLFDALNDLRNRYTQDAFVYLIDDELQPLQ